MLGEKSTLPCESCGANAHSVDRRILAVPLQSSFGEPWIDPYGPTNPFLLTYCENCYRARLFLSKAYGVGGVDYARPLPPPKPANIKVRTPMGEQLLQVEASIFSGEEAAITGEHCLPVRVCVDPNLRLVAPPASTEIDHRTDTGRVEIIIKSCYPAPLSCTTLVAVDITKSHTPGTTGFQRADERLWFTTVVQITATLVENPKARIAKGHALANIKVEQYVREKRPDDRTDEAK